MLRRGPPKLLSCKRSESTDLFTDEAVSTSQLSASTRPTSTPIRTNNPSEDEDSPYFPCSTQEMNEDVDVLWDWNSPQSKPKTSITRKSRKRLILQNSPKVPLRRHPSNNNEQIKQDFNKLRAELQALKAEIAKPDNEESLVLSPREEEVFKREDNHMEDMLDFAQHDDHLQGIYEDFHDPFDDDMDEKLILFSQQIEKNVDKPKPALEFKNSNIVESRQVSSSSSGLANNINKDSNKPWDINQPNLLSLPKITMSNYDNWSATEKTQRKIVFTDCPPSVMHQKKTEPKRPFQNHYPTTVRNEQVVGLQDSEVFNDSFDNVLSQMDDVDLDQLTQVVDIKKSLSENFVATEVVQMTSGKVEWHRTQSFESYNAQLSKEKLQEIERKRLEAKAKREAKKRPEIVPTGVEISDSPIKFSPDEIEKKRLQALEKLEAKRLQDIIEKKKQEALKRREESRKKKAANVKSSLSTRL